MTSKEDLWRAFATARDTFREAQARLDRVIADGARPFVIADARADLAVAEIVRDETARAWLAADRGDAA